ncbi:complement C3-like [Astyanax mexicanus]|uniref:Complement C3-like n=1 Tax=Astyanax mexicanus TaxID=7994 RepID=A0A8T2KXX9_ASTMX|nr:complement C3-like [Astyanax mexicanus]
MQLDLLWITAALLASGPVLTLCAPLYLFSAPQVMRVGTQEKVLVEVQDYTGSDSLNAEIRVMNFPLKDRELTSASVQLEPGNGYQALVNITIPFREDVFDPDTEEYVFLKASIGGHNMEKRVMVSFQAGYLFIQTDKTIYTPESTVRYRVFPMSLDGKQITSPAIVEIMTPEGIVIQSVQYSLLRTLKSEYKLGNPTSPGIWKIVASFKESRYQNFTAEFEVKEYVLPSFEIKLEPEDPDKTFFHVNDESFTVNIKARYLFGQDVVGTAFVVFGVLIDNKKTSLRSSLSRVSIQNGEGQAVLTKQHITNTFPNIDELVGKALYVTVSVLTDTGSEMVEAERRGIYIVKSPYTIHFTKTPKYFKPGMPFDFMVYVTNPDGTPAGKLDVMAISGDEKVCSKTDENGLVKLTINTKKASSSLDITVRSVTKILSEIPSENRMTAQAYQGKAGSQNYLHINIPGGLLKVGDSSTFNLNVGTSPGAGKQDFSVLILSKGRIIKALKYVKSDHSVLAVQISITKEMLPSFRVVAYYHVGSAEVVADSVWVDVKDTCMGTLEVSVENAAFMPTQSFTLKIAGDPGAKVGLVAVDKGVYVLNNKNRLNQKKIWDIVEKNDIACTAGSGKDSMGVFYDAGLTFHSDTAGGTAERTGYSCPTASKRKRREITKAQLRETLVGQYSEGVRQCCLDGLVENRLGYTCERRAEYVEDGKECRDAFLECCKKLAQTRKELVQEELILARNEIEDEDDDYDEDEITSRSVFPESWIWDDKELKPCGGKPKCDMTIRQILPDSITTWVITAISQSLDNGVCVAEPLELKVSKPFFIDLKLPYSTVVQEQIEIKAIIHNLNESPIEKVLVELKDTPAVCSMASFKKRYRTTVNVGGKSSRAVPFIILPLAAGEHSIEVLARSPNMGATDGVIKKLKVVSQGVLTSTGEITLLLEPKGGTQRSEIKRPTLTNQMPNTDAFTYIAVRGRPLSQLVKVAVSGAGLDQLIQMPRGCAEQNLMAMVLPLIAADYLDKTNRWEDVGVEKRIAALQYISQGYTNELSYRTATGAFSTFHKSPGSTWLTAYVVKMFSKASNLVTIDPDVICNAVRWLILSAQMPDGVFQELHAVSSSAMGGKSTQLSMTAFVLLALQESSQICAEKVNSLQSSMNKALGFIERNIDTQTDPYAVTMASYALANANKLKRELLFRYASPDASHWPVSEGHHFTLEATGYALLTLLKIEDLKKAAPVMKWLKSEQKYEGGYRSTQATAVVFDAMSKYMTIRPSPTGGMNVSVTSTARRTSFSTTFSKFSKGIQRSDRFQANGDLTVTAGGDGEGSISVITWFYAMPNENSTKCNNFDLNVEFVRSRNAEAMGALATYTLSVETKFLNTERDSTMTILDIGILTGFTVDTNDLKELMRSDRYIHRFEMDKQLSKRGSLIIYLKKVSNKDPEKIVFKMHKMLDVGLPQPVGVTVYEYYANENSCVKFYDTERTSGTLYTICPAEVCSCAEANCAQLKEPEVPEDLTRKEDACKQRDFVYKVKLNDVVLDDSIRTYTFTILQVLKEGTDRVKQDDEREFLSHSKCEKYLNLKVGLDYLIMGPEPQRVGQGYRYVLRAENWVEYWPTSEEGQESKYEARFLGLGALEHYLDNFGCTT